MVQGKLNGILYDIPYIEEKQENCTFITVKKEDYKNFDEVRFGSLTATAGDGYFVLPERLSGILQFFNKDDDDFLNVCMPCMSFFGMVSSQKNATVIVEGMRYESFLEYGKNGNSFKATFLLRLKEEKIDAYEDITFYYYELSPNADYNNVAEIYRNYKYKNGLKTIIDKNLPDVLYCAEAPEIRVRMGWKPVPAEIEYQTVETEPEMHVAVTFEKLIELMDKMKEAGIEKAHFCLVGWNKSGHDGRWPQCFPVEEKLGGEEGLKKAIRHAQNLGYKIVAHTNSSDAYTISENYSDDIIVKDKDGNLVKGTTWSGGRMHRVCAHEAIKYTKETLEKVRDLGFKGMHYIDVLSVITPYYCHDKNHPATRKDTSLLWKEMLKYSRELFGGCASEGSRDNVAEDIDFALYCGFMKFKNLQINFTYKLIPLWELVYHGAIMACPSSDLVNVGIVERNMQLKFIEFGGRPAMYIHSRCINESPDHHGNWMGDDDLRLTNDEEMARTVSVLRQVVDFYEPLKKFQTQKMLEHKQLTDDIVKITYENGSIYVNYGEEAVIDDITIPEMDYITV